MIVLPRKSGYRRNKRNHQLVRKLAPLLAVAAPVLSVLLLAFALSSSVIGSMVLTALLFAVMVGLIYCIGYRVSHDTPKQMSDEAQHIWHTEALRPRGCEHCRVEDLEAADSVIAL